MDVKGQLDGLSIDLSGLEILPADTKTQLTDMSTAIGDINFVDLKAALSADTVTADFSSLISQLDSAADAATGPIQVCLIRAKNRPGLLYLAVLN